jgi:polar amino acid transport system substrate-binding protein
MAKNRSHEDPSVLDEILRRGRVRVAVQWSPPPEQGYPPEMYLDPETGEPSGIAPAIGDMIAEDLEVDVEFLDIPWGDQIAAVQAGEVDLLPKHTLIPSRALEVEFVDGRWLQIRITCLVRRDGPVQDLEDLRRPGVTFACWPGSSIETMIRRRFPDARLIGSPDPAVDLIAERADAILIDSVTRRFMELNPGLTLLRDADGRAHVLSREHNKIAIRAGDPRFLNWLNSWYDYRDAQGDVRKWAVDWWEPLMADTDLGEGNDR